MFTGIIERTGRIAVTRAVPGGRRLLVTVGAPARRSRIGARAPVRALGLPSPDVAGGALVPFSRARTPRYHFDSVASVYMVPTITVFMPSIAAVSALRMYHIGGYGFWIG